jgi:hypothetical protein
MCQCNSWPTRARFGDIAADAGFAQHIADAGSMCAFGEPLAAEAAHENDGNVDAGQRLFRTYDERSLVVDGRTQPRMSSRLGVASFAAIESAR